MMKNQAGAQERCFPPVTTSMRISFADLPVELKLEIFSYFTVVDLCNLIAPVCKSWWTLSKDPTLWRDVTIMYPYTFDVRKYRNVFNVCSQLHVLRVHGIWHRFPKELSSSSRQFPFLKEIHLKDLVISNKRTFKLLTKNCCLLETFCMVSCAIMTNLNAVISDIGDFPKLKSFSFVLPVTGDMRDSCLQIIASKRQETLQELVLDGRWITDAGISSLAKCKKLESLYISKAFCITGVSLQLLGQLNLKKFKLNVPLLWDDVGHSGNVRNEDLTSFFSAPQRVHLRELGLQGVPVDGKVLKRISHFCRNLVKVSLRKCLQIRDDDMLVLLQTLPSLRFLDLSSCANLTPAVILKIPKLAPKLHTLNMSYLNVLDSSFLKELHSLLPHLILDRWGELVVLKKNVVVDDKHFCWFLH